MIMNYIIYCLLFHSHWNNWCNSHNWYKKAAMSHSMLQCAFNPIGFHYILQDQPKAHELTNHILHVVCRLALPQNDCAGSAEWFQCHWQKLLVLAVFPGYFRLGWRIELVSCSRACIGPENRQIPASLKWIHKYTSNKCHNSFYI